MKVIFITGISGSGKTTAIKTLEDLGYYTADNIPIDMIHDFLSLTGRAKIDKVALGMFFRDRESVEKFVAHLKEWKRKGNDFILIFLDSKDDTIIRRYKETRRKHPFMHEDETMKEAIHREREILRPLSDIADIKIDSSDFTIHQLREKVKAVSGNTDEFVFQIISFGFRYGIPDEADLVFDVRFVKNPNFHPDLKHLDGTHPDVQNYVFEDSGAREYLKMIEDMLMFLADRFKKEGKYVATVSIGCTGGRHRSVAFAEKLKDFIREKLKIRAFVIHRDIDKQSPL